MQPIGSMFFIDPLYPLYMLIGVVAALSMKQFAGLRWNASYGRKWANPLCIFSS